MTAAGDQIVMFPEPHRRNRRELWVGIATTHRRLFDALQDGWYRPLPPRGGLLVGVDSYTLEHDAMSGPSTIPVRIRLNPTKLPNLDVSIYRDSRWVPSQLEAVASTDVAILWPGALPTFAISELSVETEEKRARLTGLARRVSNAALPEVPIRVSSALSETIGSDLSIPDVPAQLIVPREEDAAHGAMSMAVWGVPRIDPWLDLLTASLSLDLTLLASLAAVVDAGWWRFPPWVTLSEASELANPQEALWLAAVNVFRDRTPEASVAPNHLAERIAAEASRFRCAGTAGAASRWLDAVKRDFASGDHHSARGMAVLSGGNCHPTCVDPAGANQIPNLVQGFARLAASGRVVWNGTVWPASRIQKTRRAVPRNSTRTGTFFDTCFADM